MTVLQKAIKQINSNWFLTSLAIGIVVAVKLFNPFVNNGVFFDNGMIGPAVINDLSINALVKKWELLLLFYIPVISGAICFILSYLERKYNDIDKETNWKNQNIIALVSLFSALSRLTEPEIIFLRYLYLFIFLCLMLNTGYIVFRSSLAQTFEECDVIFLQLQLLNVFIIVTWLIKDTSLSFVVISVILTICLMVMVLILYVLQQLYSREKIYNSFTLSLFSVIALSFTLEIIAIINENGGAVQRIRFVVLTVIFIIVVMSVVLLISKKQRFKNNANHWYLIVLIGVGMIANQPSVYCSTGIELMEKSNHATAIYQFFSFGKIPVLESFDAHMLSSQWGSYLHALVSGSTKDAAFFTCYDGLINVLIIIIAYTFFLHIFDRYTAFWLTSATFLIEAFILSKCFLLLLGIMILYKYYLNRTARWFVGLIFYNIATCFYALDVGFASVVTMLLAFALFTIKDKRINIRHIKYFVMIVLGCFTIAFTIAMIRDINLMDRIVEFISVSSSNDLFAFATQGDPNDLQYKLIYYIIPLILVSIIIYEICVFLCNTKCEFLGFTIIFLSIMYFVNFQRTLVRHNLNEMVNSTTILTTSVLAVSLFVLQLYRKKTNNQQMEAGVFLGVTLCIVFIFSASTFKDYSMKGTTMAKAFGQVERISAEEYRSLKGSRVIYEDALMDFSKPLKKSLNATLEGNETFFDFTSQTLLFPLTERINPVYVNQSPMLLTNYENQKRCIEQIKKSNTTYALMNIVQNENIDARCNGELDGIQNSYHYRTVYKWINQNYTPFFRVGDFEVWCKKDKIEEKKKVIEEQKLISKLKIELLDGKTGILEKVFVLNKYPMIEGRNLEDTNNEMTKVDKINIINRDVNKDKLIFSIKSDKEFQTDLRLQVGGREVLYNFTVMHGNNTYVLYLGTNRYWYEEKNIQIQIDKVARFSFKVEE